MNNNMQNSDPNANWYGADQQNVYANSPYTGPNQQSPQFSSSLFNNPHAKLNANGPYRRRGRGCTLGIILSLVILFILIGAGVGIFSYVSRSFSTLINPNSGGSQGQISNTVTIPTTTHPTVIIASGSSFVRIHAGKDTTHIVAGIINATFDSSAPTFTTSNNGSTITFDDTLSGDLDLTVPTTTNLQIDDDGIEVIGVVGQMSLTSPSAAITLIQSTLTGQSKLDNNGGPIFALEDLLGGQVTMSNNGGPITFSGSVSTNGKYTFSTNGSSIDLTLPATANFHLDVTGIIDAFTSDFPGIGSPDPNSGEIHQDIGHSPTSTIAIDINGAPITLHKSDI